MILDKCSYFFHVCENHFQTYLTHPSFFTSITPPKDAHIGTIIWLPREDHTNHKATNYFVNRQSSDNKPANRYQLGVPQDQARMDFDISMWFRLSPTLSSSYRLVVQSVQQSTLSINQTYLVCQVLLIAFRSPIYLHNHMYVLLACT